MREKPTHTIALVGSKDSGKSTLLGQILIKMGMISEEQVEILTKSTYQRSECKYSFLSNKSRRERDARQLSFRQVEIKNYYCNFIDTPGSVYGMGRALRGLSTSSVIIAVIDPREHHFQESINRVDGLLWTYLLATKATNQQVICCVNYMDHSDINYSEQSFMKIASEVMGIMTRIGYSWALDCIPISGYCGDNIVELSDKTPWYKGKCLLDSLNSLKNIINNDHLFLRIPILAVKKIRNSETLVYGKIETGTIRLDSKIVVSNPNVQNLTIKSIESFGKRIDEAKSGQLVSISLGNVDQNLFKKGDVILGEGSPPGKVTRFFKANIIIFSHPNVIKAGYTPTIQLLTSQVKCKIVKIIEVITHKALSETCPPHLKKGERAIVECELAKDCYLDTNLFSTFYIRDLKRLIGMGVITRTGKAGDD